MILEVSSATSGEKLTPPAISVYAVAPVATNYTEIETCGSCDRAEVLASRVSSPRIRRGG